MGIERSFPASFGKAMLASGIDFGALRGRDGKPRAFVSVKDEDKPAAIRIARRLAALGFEVTATRGTAAALARAGVAAEVLNKVNEGPPGVIEEIRAGKITMVVNTTIGAKEVRDSYSLRRHTLLANIPYFTTIAAALAACDALEAAQADPEVRVRSLQEWSGLV
jgi:carbamoyl-phosphate synthase large subunit